MILKEYLAITQQEQRNDDEKKHMCSKCKEIKPLFCFHKNQTNKNGLASQCKDCYNAHKRAKYAENPEIDKARKQIFYAKNPEYNKNYNNLHRDKIKNTNKIYQKENAEAIKIKKHFIYIKNKKIVVAKAVAYEKNRKEIDPIYKFKKTLRSSIRSSIKNSGFTKTSKTSQILGCTFEEFKIYIENQFLPWMSWNNNGLYNGEYNFGWDLDHIIPLSSATTTEEIITLNHYTNFQPLCSYVNRYVKMDKLDFYKQKTT